MYKGKLVKILKMYVGITDYDWFKTLKQANCDEVNFWKPGGKTNFKALDEGTKVICFYLNYIVHKIIL